MAAQLIFALNESGEIATAVEVENTPPSLLSLIPNQSWPSGTYLINAFDLDDYFFDAQGDVLNYSYSAVQNISVDIDASNNVSFYQDLDFVGNRSVVFYAFDGTYNVSSNTVYLFVVVDDDPPKWSSPSKSRSVIYQNSYVNFTTLWTDNVGLESYVFSINQGGWVNYTGYFSGLQNISAYRVQISAPAGSVVEWMFCAYDTSNNFNCTDIQNFSVSSAPTPVSAPAPQPSAYAGEGAGFLAFLAGKRTQKFELNVDSFKVSLRQGDTETKILEIINTGNTNLSFNLSISGVEKFVTLSEYNFTLLPGEKKRIIVDFSAFKNSFPGQYFGELIVESSQTKRIPLVIDINPLNLQFEVNVSIFEAYKRVKPGEMVKAKIKVRSVQDISPVNLSLYIALKDLYGNIYDSSEESFLFSSSLDLERDLSVPEEVREGEYIFYARASSDDAVAIDSDFFEVGTRLMFAAFLKSSFVFILIVILSVFSAILVSKYRHEREKERILNLYVMLNELRRLVGENKIDEAVELYIKIKTIYKEPVSKSVLENKEKLKEEIKKLANKLRLEKKAMNMSATSEEKEGEKSVEKGKKDVKDSATGEKESVGEKKKEKSSAESEDKEVRAMKNENIKKSSNKLDKLKKI